MQFLTLVPSGVYVIENLITHEFYIGSSKNVEERLKYHKRLSTWKQHLNSRLYQDMLKYGLENFSFRRMKEVEVEHLKEKKIEYIRMLNPTYNVRSVKGLNIEKYKETQKRYRQSEKYKETQKRYRQSEKYKETQKRYRQSDKGKAAQRRFYEKYKQNKIYIKLQCEKYKEYYDQLCKYGYNDNEQTVLSLALVGSDLGLGSARKTREYNVVESPVKSKRVLVAE